MKKILALFAFVLALSVNASFAQTADSKAKATPTTEQTVSKDATHSCSGSAKGGACCASHGAKAEAKDDAAGVKTASTTHEHAGKTCDPAHCTEADKKSCTKAHGKSCCMSTASTEEKETPKP